MRHLLQLRRFMCTKILKAHAPFRCARLTNRTLLRINGVDTMSFLQGLLTNDVNRLNHGSLYSLILNDRGRILFDLFVYRLDGDKVGVAPNLLLDCDSTQCESVADWLLKYRLRKKVDLVSCSDSLAIFAVYPHLDEDEDIDSSWETTSDKMVLPTVDRDINGQNPIVWVHDPRLPLFGSRLVLPDDSDEIAFYSEEFERVPLRKYTESRYLHGLAEGPLNSPYGKSLPLESNGDYMNGISFHKGCYIGQELTARSHHTGIVRKRLMPIRVIDNDENLNQIECDSPILDTNSKLVGKFRHGQDRFGMALLRIEDAVKADQLYLQVGEKRIRIRTWKPSWWPVGQKEIRTFQAQQ